MSDINEENRWAVYPIEKVEAAMKELSEAIFLARKAQRTQSDSEAESELDRLLCPGCFDRLPKEGSSHMWLDGSNIESCLATAERKKRIRDYFAKQRVRYVNEVEIA